jgi:hypothetical protein
MKHLEKMNEIVSKYDAEKRQYNFDPADNGDNKVTFYLHGEQKQGFVMEIEQEDQQDMEKLLNKNRIDYTISTARNILPF